MGMSPKMITLLKLCIIWIMQLEFYCFDTNVGVSPLFQPDGCSREIWEANCGCNTEQHILIKEHCYNLQKYLAETLVGAESVNSSDVEQRHPCQCIDDMNMDDFQIMSIAKTLDMKKRRKKRKIRQFEDFPISKWSTDIFYKLDGTLDQVDQKKVKEALHLWADSTCLTFKQLDIATRKTEQHLIFIKNAQYIGCYSYVGKIRSQVPQPIYLSPSCFNLVGYIAHEIGHSLGLFHEHQRQDRDKFIKIVSSNIKNGAEGNFAIVQGIENMGVPYDLSSIMHYTSLAFSSNREYTIEANDKLFQSTIGQRMELSFHDINIVNKAYCSDKCSHIKLTKACKNGGYQDPMDCHKCRCPDSYGGNYCDELSSPKGVSMDGNAYNHGGIIQANEKEYTLSSTGFNPFLNMPVEIFWQFKAAEGSYIRLRFANGFGLPMYGKTCKHWLEIRYNKDLTIPGPRFCGYNTPPVVLVSWKNEARIIFKAKSSSVYRNWQGFKLLFDTNISCNDEPCKNGGSCNQNFNRYTCVCANGWFGHHCEIDSDESNTYKPSGDSAKVPDTTETSPIIITNQATESYSTASTSAYIQNSIITDRNPVTTTTTPNKSTLSTLLKYLVTKSDNCWWSTSDCSQNCGGCGKKTTQRICKYADDKEQEVYNYHTDCGPEACQVECKVWIAGYYTKTLLKCCDGYVLDGYNCVKKS